MKKIPFKNYVKVLLLFIVTIVGCLILANNYNDKKTYERENNHLKNFISNVKYDELQNYLTENCDGYIYVAPSIDTSLENFELQLKDLIINEEMEREFVYLDSSSLGDDDYQMIKKFFNDSLNSKKIDIPECANIFVVRDGKIIDILFTNKSDITLDNVKNFITKYQEAV